MSTQTASPVTIAGGRNSIILSRGYCLFRRFDLTHVPQSRRRAALRTEIERWLPFVNVGYFSVWLGGVALVWGWDRARVERNLQVENATVEFIPETVLRPTCSGTGLVLRTAIDGVTGQSWRNGELFSEVWWPQLPSLSTWHSFCRANSFSPSPIPDAEADVWESTPWAGRSSSPYPDLRSLERWVGIGGLVVLLSIGAFQVGAAARLVWLTSSIEAETDALSTEAEPVLSARSRALNARYESVRLLKTFDAPQPQAYFTLVAALLPAGAKIVDWTFNINTVEFSIEGAATSPLEAVKLFQGISQLQDVSAVPGRKPGQMVISANVR